MLPTKDSLNLEGLSEESKKDFPSKWKPKRIGVTILISDEIDFK